MSVYPWPEPPEDHEWVGGPDEAVQANNGLTRLTDGAAFILDQPEDVPALWGEGSQVLWAEGESLLITGTPGVGKTTIAQQVVLAMVGLGSGSVLGLPVQARDRVLYLAMDRPRQIGRSFRRMVGDTPVTRTVLSQRLVIWQGPPPQDVARDTGTLLRLARRVGADVLVIDSLKDAALGLVNDDTGAAVNRALQTCLADGVEVLVLHHQVKRSGSGDGGKPVALADVYGSAWITAGAGSVVLVHGEAGDSQVEVRHLKQPAEVVGPLRVEHDHVQGQTRIAADHLDPEQWLIRQRQPVTADHLAQALGLREDAKPAEVRAARERARRLLEGLVRRGTATKDEGERGGVGGRVPTTYESVRQPGQQALALSPEDPS